MRLGPLGVPELLIILVVVLLVFGPKRLPEMAKGIGQSVREFRKGIRDMKEDIDRDDEPAQTAPKQAKVVESPTSPTVETVSAAEVNPAEVKVSPVHNEAKEEVKA